MKDEIRTSLQNAWNKVSGFDRGVSGKRIAIKAVSLIALLAVLYFIRPLIHPIAYNIAYSPLWLILVGTTLLTGAILFLIPPIDESLVEGIGLKAGLLVVIFFIALVPAIAVGVPAGALEERALADRTMGDAEKISDFPEVNEDNARIAPRAVSDVQTKGSVSYQQYRLGESDIARTENGSLAWSYEVQPDGFRNSLREHQQGVVLSDMTTMEDRNIEATDNSSFAVGEGMLLHRSAEWNLKKTDYWTQYRDDPTGFVHDDQPYVAYSKTSHEWRVDWVFGFIPVPYTVPVWDGVALLHENGTIDHLSQSEAQESDILEGQRLYPLHLTQREMGSLGYRNGIVNQWPVVGSHENEVELAGMPSGTGNSQPFTIDLQGERMSYVTALEPYGDDTRGLDEVWFVDARTGDLRYYDTGDSTLRGPERAMGIVRGEDSRTGWGDDFEVVEPVPVTVNGELWWHSKVVTADNTDITRNVFVNAHNGDAVEVQDTEAVHDFIAGENVSEVDEVITEPADGEDDIQYYVVLLDEDGNELERIEVEEGQDVEIVQEDPDDS